MYRSSSGVSEKLRVGVLDINQHQGAAGCCQKSAAWRGGLPLLPRTDPGVTSYWRIPGLDTLLPGYATARRLTDSRTDRRTCRIYTCSLAPGSQKVPKRSRPTLAFCSPERARI